MIPSVLEAEEKVVNLFHGKTTQTLTLLLYYFQGCISPQSQCFRSSCTT